MIIWTCISHFHLAPKSIFDGCKLPICSHGNFGYPSNTSKVFASPKKSLAYESKVRIHVIYHHARLLENTPKNGHRQYASDEAQYIVFRITYDGKSRTTYYVLRTTALRMRSAWSVPIAQESHLFPFRTQKLSLVAVKILGVYPWENSTVPFLWSRPPFGGLFLLYF